MRDDLKFWLEEMEIVELEENPLRIERFYRNCPRWFKRYLAMKKPLKPLFEIKQQNKDEKLLLVIKEIEKKYGHTFEGRHCFRELP